MNRREWLSVLGLVSTAFIACSSEPNAPRAVASSEVPDAGDQQQEHPWAPPPGTGGSGVFEAPFGEWTWQDIPGTKCAQGSETGFGYKRGTGDKVFIFMEGGSVCIDADCKSSPFYTKWTGYGSKQFFDALAQTPGSYQGQPGIDVAFGFRELNSASPTFADASLVYIPYCSGDYFIGNTDKKWDTWTAQYRGKNNVALFFRAIAAGFPKAARVILSGGSAGSVGAMQNYHQAVTEFGGKRVDLVTDSYSMIGTDIPQFIYPVLGPVMPPNCPTCATDYRTIYNYDAQLAATVGGRIAILDTENDWTLDWALHLQQQADYTSGLKSLQTYLDQFPNTRYYVANGNNHILMKDVLGANDIDVKQRVDGSLATDTHYLSEFLTRMQNDDPKWQSLSALRDDLLSCKTDCNGRTCGSDSCGGTCGTCPSGWSCDSDYGQCTKDGAFDVGEAATLETSVAAFDLYASKITLTTNASLLKTLSLYADNAVAKAKFQIGLYDASGDGGGPGKLLATTDSFENIAGWNKKPVKTFVALPAGDYWLGFQASSNTLRAKQSTKAGSYVKASAPWGSLPATFPAGTAATGHFSIYATVTP
jgi:hypothetical protein